jgi:hypothetical protein
MNAPRRRFLVFLAVLVPAGLSTRFYSGPMETWVRDSLGGVFYEMFWIGLIGLIRPPRRPWIAGVTVFGATCILEASQLWHPAFLEAIRGSFPGRILVGTTFAWSDFPHYAAGCLVGSGLTGWMAKSSGGCKPENDGAGGQKNPPTG